MTWTAPYDGGPNEPTDLPGLSFFQAAMIALSAAMLVI